MIKIGKTIVNIRFMKIWFLTLNTLLIAGCATFGSDNYYEAASVEEEKSDSNGSLMKWLVTGTGLAHRDNSNIAQSVRPPLVRPKNTKLVAPQAPLLTQQDVKDWPKDFDENAASREKKRLDYETRTNLRDSVTGRERVVLTNEEMQAGTRKNTTQRSAISHLDGYQDRYQSNVLSPEMMKKGHKSQTKKYSKQIEEDGIVRRRSLLEPPIEYQQPTAYDVKSNLQK